MPPANDTPLSLHHAIARDVPSIFKMYERDQRSEGARSETFERLRTLVRCIGSSGEFDLVDVSSSSLKNIPRFHIAPLECTIVDKTRPDGLPPSFGDAALPTAYDAIAVAKLLTENGYQGTFVDVKPDLLGYDTSDPEALHRPPILPSEPAWGQLTAPFCSMFNVLPPILRIRPENTEHPEIHLSPVHPSNQLRWSILRQACDSSESFRILTSFFWLWLRSHGILHYSWTTCAFLVMFHLQDCYKPTVQPTSSTQPSSQEFWNRIQTGLKPEYERLAVPQMHHIPDPQGHPGLLFNFFHYWAGNRNLSLGRALDPLSGMHIPRSQIYKNNRIDLDEVEIMERLRAIGKEGSRDSAEKVKTRQVRRGKTKQGLEAKTVEGQKTKSKDEQQQNLKAEEGHNTAYWQYNPLVLVDPFLPYHNLAHTVTKHAFQLLTYQAKLAARTLKSGQPLTEIFGASLQSVCQPIEWLEPSSSSQSPALPASSQRNYHTSARSAHKPPLPEIHAPPQVSRHVLEARERTIKQIQRVVRERYGNQYLVECFGSTQYGVDSPTSDLDLVILDEDRKTGFTPLVSLRSLPVIYNVRNLATTLERNGFKILRVIVGAAVPIVKFEDPRTRMICDINVNERLGLFNTQLIAQYCALSPLLRPLLVMLKQWAKTLGLNDPSGEGGATTFSSYAMTVMTVGFFQAHDLLPNLQAGLPEMTLEDEFWICGRGGERSCCDPRFTRSPTWTAPNNALISDLRGALSAWFRFWGHQFNYNKEVMNIRDGGVVPRTDKAIASVTAERQAKNRKEKEEKRLKAEKKAAEKAERRVRAQGQGKTSASLKDDGSDDAKSVEDANSESGRDEPPGAVDDVDEAARDKMDEADLQRGKQPGSWALATLVVADPFIAAKNVTGSIMVRAIERFTSECRRSLVLLSAGARFDELLGDGSSIGRGGYPRRSRGGKGAARDLTAWERQRLKERGERRITKLRRNREKKILERRLSHEKLIAEQRKLSLERKAEKQRATAQRDTSVERGRLPERERVKRTKEETENQKRSDSRKDSNVRSQSVPGETRDSKGKGKPISRNDTETNKEEVGRPRAHSVSVRGASTEQAGGSRGDVQEEKKRRETGKWSKRSIAVRKGATASVNAQTAI